MEKSIIKISMIGHVDTGKSTTLGNLLYLTGNISEHNMEKTRKEAENNGKKKFCYAYLLDIDIEERNRGITQSYNIIDFMYQDKNYKLIDTPGHKIYIREMIEALSTNNDSVVCLLVSCIENEFNSSLNGGTTLEDLLLIRGCNIQNLIILVNKIDLLDINKLLINYNMIVNKMNLLINKLGFKSVVYLPISGYEGWNLINSNDVINTIIKPKYNTLLEAVNKIKENIHNSIILNKKTKLKNKIKVHFNVLNLDKIITIGYKFILHIVDMNEEDSELLAEIVLIHSLQEEKKLYINNGDKLYVGLLLDKQINVYNEQRVIFRDNLSTIGFGKIIIDNK